MSISIKNYSEIVKNLGLLNEELGTIVVSAVNATAKKLKEIATDKIESNTGLDADKIDKRITISKASSRIKEIATITASGKRLALSSYDPSMSFVASRGTVSSDISMLRGTQVIGNRAFANPSMPRLALRRKTEQAYPISAATGPSVGHHFDRIKDELIKIGEDDLLTRFTTRIRKAINRQG